MDRFVATLMDRLDAQNRKELIRLFGLASNEALAYGVPIVPSELMDLIWRMYGCVESLEHPKLEKNDYQCIVSKKIDEIDDGLQYVVEIDNDKGYPNLIFACLIIALEELYETNNTEDPQKTLCELKLKNQDLIFEKYIIEKVSLFYGFTFVIT